MATTKIQSQLTIRTRDSQGAVMVLLALLMVGICGIAAFAFDLGIVYNNHRAIQFASDSASLAGARLMAEDDLATLTDIRTRALDFGDANGLVNNVELNPNDIELGNWDPGTLAFAVTNDPDDADAVRVRGQRSVPMFFGRVIGTDTMNPNVESVSLISGGETAKCLKPFGLEETFFPDLDIPTLPSPYIFDDPGFPVIVDGSQSEGLWGKIDISDENGDTVNMSSAPNFCHYMIDEPCPGNPDGDGCGLADLTLGDDYLAAPGVSAEADVFEELIGEEIQILITGVYGHGSSPVTVHRYALATVDGVTGNGNNIEVELRIHEITTDPLNEGEGEPASWVLVH